MGRVDLQQEKPEKPFHNRTDHNERPAPCPVGTRLTSSGPRMHGQIALRADEQTARPPHTVNAMTTTISLTADDGHTLNAFVAEPLGTAAAGIVVIQEIFGVNGHIQQDTTRFADAGYLAIAPHMFDRVKTGVNLGYSAETIAEGRDFAMALTPAGIMADVRAAAVELQRRGVTKIGIVGYCFGGTVAASAACYLSDLFTASVAYYGGGVGDLVTSGAMPQIPLMLHFGEKDVWITAETVEAVAATWPGPVHRYDANHGFHCDQRADYDQAASDLAQDRTLAWFAEHLG